MTSHVTLPTVDTDVLAGRHEANNIAENLTAAYWLHSHDASTALYLLRGAHRDLAAMADAMGYTLTPKADDAVEVAA